MQRCSSHVLPHLESLKTVLAANGVQYFCVSGWTSTGDANLSHSIEKAPLSRLSGPRAWLQCPSACTEYLFIAMLVPLQECYSVLGEGAAVEGYMLFPQLCHACYVEARNKFSIVVKCKRSQCLWCFCRGLLGMAIRDILALYFGRACCYDVKVRVDRVKADVQVCF